MALPAREAGGRGHRHAARPEPESPAPPATRRARHRREERPGGGGVEDDDGGLDAVDQLPRRPRGRLGVERTERDVEGTELFDDVAEEQRAGCGERARKTVRDADSRADAEAPEQPSAGRPLACERRRGPGEQQKTVAGPRDADAHRRRGVCEATGTERQVLELIVNELVASRERQLLP